MMRLSIVLSGVAIALAACGGTASPAATTAPGATVAGSTQSTATAAASGPSIADLLRSGSATPYKATYTYTVTASGQTVATSQTWYHKGPNTRFDYSVGPASFSIFSLADGTYTCTSAGGTSSCQKSAGQAALGQNPAADFAVQLQADPSKFRSSFTGTQTIAGQQAQCFSVPSAGLFGDVSTCYSPEGVPLKTTMTAAGSTITTEATAFSTTVSDADFALPGPVR